MPLKLTSTGLSGPVSVMTREAVRLPMAAGAKVRCGGKKADICCSANPDGVANTLLPRASALPIHLSNARMPRNSLRFATFSSNRSGMKVVGSPG